ncbi:MAG: hypothetical protein Q8R44_11545 [Novosphingobium sp.]|nr:hypothetical protein [Novosphingobium sp.]
MAAGVDAMDKLRVIQWTTGKVGKLALRGVLDDPRLELAGVYAYSDDKAGKDAGELCGRSATGVIATSDIAVLIALGADSVLYTPFMADLDDVVRLLESGLDVVSTNLLSNLGGVKGEVAAALEAACARGNSSLYITGVNPGWVNNLAATMTAVCRDVQLVSIAESANVATYESAETWLSLGFSLSEASPEVLARAQGALLSFRDAVERLAEALEFELDDMEFFIEHAKAAKRTDLGWFVMEQGTNAAMRGGWNGKADGRTVVQIRVAWYLTKDLTEGWDFDDDHYEILVQGEPSIRAKLRFIPPESWGNHEWDTMTAMPAVNVLGTVKAARPGVLALADVGLAVAPAGLWGRA